jgi:L-threonylcarbamoyladenylate synthase
VKLSIIKAAGILRGGGIIAYPTEGLYGLGCLPDDTDAVLRLLHIKRRDPAKGLILLASNRAQLSDWIDTDGPPIPDPDPNLPVTWVAPVIRDDLSLLQGQNKGLAVRLTTNATAAAICDAVAAPIVSTSANVAGERPARNQYVLRRKFAACVDYIVPGECGPSSGPSEIRDLISGKTLRPSDS